MNELIAADPDQAVWATINIGYIVDDLGQQSAKADLSLTEARAMQLMLARSYVISGHAFAARRQYREAVDDFGSATNIYRVEGHRPERADAELAAAIYALLLPQDDPGHEDAMLDSISRALADLEAERGALRDRGSRSTLLTSRDRFQAEMIRVLAERVRFARKRAAEVLQWFLESRQRNALSDAVRRQIRASGDAYLVRTLADHEALEATTIAVEASQQSTTAPARWQPTGDLAALRRRLAEQTSEFLTDVMLHEHLSSEQVRRVLGERIAVHYHCRRDTAGWHITATVTSPDGVQAHHTTIAVVPTDPERPVSPLRTPAGLLDGLNGTDAPTIRRILHTIRLDDPVWSGLAAALLPAGLPQTLATAARHGATPVLVFVPDGPLGLVPFAGLRLPDGTALIEHAAIALAPNLAILRPSAPPPAQAVIIQHIGPTRLADELDMLGYRRFAEVVDTGTYHELVAALRGTQASVAVISHHGERGDGTFGGLVHLRDGTTLSAETAPFLPWPGTALLGACWAGNVAVSAGQEPIGMPTACLLGGANHVIGGQGEIGNTRVSAGILARMVIAVALGRDPAVALHQAITQHRRVEQDPWPPATAWATLVTWTAAAASDLAAEASPQRRNEVGRRPVKPFPAGHFVPTRTTGVRIDLPISASLARAFAYARTKSPNQILSSLDLFAAIVAVDDADWTSFSVAAGIGVPPWEEFDVAGPFEAVTVHPGQLEIVGAAVAWTIEVADGLAQRMGDPAITPAHLVYAILHRDKGQVVEWIRSHPDTPSDLLALLSDRIFGADLPPLEELKVRRRKPFIRMGGGRIPRNDAELLRLIGDATARSTTGIAGTLDFLCAMGIAPADTAGDREYEHGGVRLESDGSTDVVVSAQLVDAIQSARKIAYDRGDRAVTPIHVLYGIVGDPPCAGALWLARNDQAAVTARAMMDHRLGTDRIPPDLLPSSPPQTQTGDFALVLAYLGWRGIRWSVIKLAKFQAAIALLFLLGVIIAVQDLYEIPPGADRLAAIADQVTATVTLDDHSTRPAVLIGPVADYYRPPSTASDSAPPSSLQHWYLFAVPTSKPHATTPVAMTYRGREQRATMTCPPRLSQAICLVSVELNGVIEPSWTLFGLTDTQTGHRIGNRAMLLHPTIGAPAPATLWSAPDTDVDQHLLLRVRANAKNGPDYDLTPVLLADEQTDGMLHLLGLAIIPANGDYGRMVQSYVLTAYTSATAGLLIAATSDAPSYAGIIFKSDGTEPGVVDDTYLASPADFAGLATGDRITAVDGTPVATGEEANALLWAHRPGKTAEVTFTRDGASMTTTVTLGYLPQGYQRS